MSGESNRDWLAGVPGVARWVWFWQLGQASRRDGGRGFGSWAEVDSAEQGAALVPARGAQQLPSASGVGPYPSRDVDGTFALGQERCTNEKRRHGQTH